MMKKMTWGMLIGSIVTFATIYGPQTFIQYYTRELHMTSTQSSLVLSITTFTLAFSMLIMAAISNAIGRKKIMVFSLIGASVLYIAVGFAPNFETLLLLRALQGIATAGFPAIAVTYLAEELDPKDFPKVLGIYITGSGVGGFFGRIISSSLLDATNVQIAILTLGTITLLLSIAFIVLIEPSKHFHKQPFSISNLGQGLMAAAKDGKLLCFYGLGFLALGVYVAVFNFAGFPLMDQYGLSQTLVGFIFIFQLMGSAGSMIVGKLNNQYSRTQILMVTLIVSIIGIAFTLVHALIAMLIGLFIISISFFAWHQLVSGWVSNSAAPETKAYASSLYLLSYYIGSSVVGTLGGHFYDTNAWQGVGFLLISCVLIALLLLAIVKTTLKHQHVSHTK